MIEAYNLTFVLIIKYKESKNHKYHCKSDW